MAAFFNRSFFVRLGTGLVIGPLVLVLIIVPALRPGLALLICLLAGVGLREFNGLVRARGYETEGWLFTFAGVAVIVAAYWGAVAAEGVLTLSVVILLAWHLLEGKHGMAAVGASMIGLIWIGWFGAHVLLINGIPQHGPALMLLLFFAVVLSDVGAYFAGKLWGRTPLAPTVSPKKTWEGSAGGILLATLGCTALDLWNRSGGWVEFPEWPAWRFALTGLAVACVEQIGDLIESAFKRDAGVKDSGEFFPGHGGVLDRCDGFLFAAPLLYYAALL